VCVWVSSDQSNYDCIHLCVAAHQKGGCHGV
jgi:hypothetical protein